MFKKKRNDTKSFIPPGTTVRVMRAGQPKFFAAHSALPFAEEHEDYPDYAFYTLGNRYWCVRVGDLEVPWGVCVDVGNSNELWANGIIRVKRLNRAATLDGKGFEYVKASNGVFYLYEKVFQDNRFSGFVIRLRDEFLPILSEIARAAKDPTAFQRDLQNFSNRADATAVLGKDLIFSENGPVRLDGVGINKKTNKE